MASSGLSIGDVLQGRYEIIDLLGIGGFGRVVKARHIAMDRPVAIKFLQLQRVTDDRMRQTMKKRFLQEAQIISKLHHPNTVQVHDFGVLEDDPDAMFMVVEYIEGRALDQIVSGQGRLSAEVVAHILKQALGSLDEAHGVGVIHRDIKPANIMVTERLGDPWFVKVLDFGIAAPLPTPDAPTVEGLTMTGSIIGTPGHMSPEQLCGEPVTPASDIYCMGLVGYELLVGDPAYSTEVTAPALSHQAFGPDVQVPESLGTAQLRHVVNQALKKDTAERFLDAQSFLDALTALDQEVAQTPEAVTAALGTAPTQQVDVSLLAAEDVRTDPTPEPIPPAEPEPEPRPDPTIQQTPSDLDPPREPTIEEPTSVPAPSPSASPQSGSSQILLIVAGFISAIVVILAVLLFAKGDKSVTEPDKAPATEVQPHTPKPRAALDAMILTQDEPLPPRSCQARSPEVIGVLTKAVSKLEGGRPLSRRPEDRAALALIDSLSEDLQNGSEVRAWHARAHLFTGDLEAARTRIEAAVSICEGDALAHKTHGDVLLLQRQRPEAIKAYEKAVGLSADYGAARYNLGLAKLLEREYTAAVTIFGELMVRDGDYEGVHTARARAYLALGEYDLAMKDADEALKQDPEDGEAHFVRGAVLQKRGMTEASMASMCKAKALGVARATCVGQ